MHAQMDDQDGDDVAKQPGSPPSSGSSPTSNTYTGGDSSGSRRSGSKRNNEQVSPGKQGNDDKARDEDAMTGDAGAGLSGSAAPSINASVEASPPSQEPVDKRPRPAAPKDKEAEDPTARVLLPDDEDMDWETPQTPIASNGAALARPTIYETPSDRLSDAAMIALIVPPAHPAAHEAPYVSEGGAGGPIVPPAHPTAHEDLHAQEAQQLQSQEPANRTMFFNGPYIPRGPNQSKRVPQFYDERPQGKVFCQLPGCGCVMTDVFVVIPQQFRFCGEHLGVEVPKLGEMDCLASSKLFNIRWGVVKTLAYEEPPDVQKEEVIRCDARTYCVFRFIYDPAMRTYAVDPDERRCDFKGIPGSKELIEHVGCCEHEYIPCALCAGMIKKRDQNEHLFDCKDCQVRICKGTVEAHDMVCEFKVLDCDQECEVPFKAAVLIIEPLSGVVTPSDVDMATAELAPTNLQLSNVAAGLLGGTSGTLSWSPPAAGPPEGYRVLLEGRPIGTVPGSETSLCVSSLPPDGVSTFTVVPIRCGTKFFRRDKDKHINVCLYADISCELCGAKMKRRDLEAHMNDDKARLKHLEIQHKEILDKLKLANGVATDLRELSKAHAGTDQRVKDLEGCAEELKKADAIRSRESNLQSAAICNLQNQLLAERQASGKKLEELSKTMHDLRQKAEERMAEGTLDTLLKSVTVVTKAPAANQPRNKSAGQGSSSPPAARPAPAMNSPLQPSKNLKGNRLASLPDAPPLPKPAAGPSVAEDSDESRGQENRGEPSA